MSDIPYRDPLDIREQIVRIDNAIAETHKLQNESDKFAAEARKLQRDRAFLPWTIVATLLGAGAALFAAGAGFVKLISG